MADQQPQKNDGNASGGGSKRSNRRYFRRRRNKGGGDGQAASGPEKEQSRSQPEAKGQGNRPPEQRSEQQERRRKRRRSNNSNNRRSSSSRRQRRQEQNEQTVQSAPEPERYQEPVDVFVHTHIVRPAYRDAGGEYISDGSFLSGRRPPEASIHMERLQEDIRGQLDEYLNRQPVPVKVTREAGDEDWDDEE